LLVVAGNVGTVGVGLEGATAVWACPWSWIVIATKLVELAMLLLAITRTVSPALMSDNAMFVVVNGIGDGTETMTDVVAECAEGVMLAICFV
jgi:hypothetical protein